MPFALQNLNGTVSFKLIDKPVDVINAPAPTVTMPERLWFTYSVVSVPNDVTDQQI